MSRVQKFLDQMDTDTKEVNEMMAADENLSNAIQRFERAFKTKLKITYDIETDWKPNPD